MLSSREVYIECLVTLPPSWMDKWFNAVVRNAQIPRRQSASKTPSPPNTKSPGIYASGQSLLTSWWRCFVWLTEYGRTDDMSLPRHCSFHLTPAPSFSFLIICSAAPAAKLLQSCPTLWPHRQQPTRLPHPWDSPSKNTRVVCYFLLQCMKGKSESEIAQSYPTPSDVMDCTPPESFVHGISQARVLGVPSP